MSPFWISARPNNCLCWYFWWIFSATSVICPDVTLKVSYTYFHIHSLPIIWSHIVAGTSSVVKLQTYMKKECAKVGTQWGITFTTSNIQININERSIIQIIILFHIWAANIPEISVVNLLLGNWQHIFSYLKFNPLTLELNGCSYVQKTNLNGGCIRADICLYDFVCFVDRASLYNLANKTNLVRSLFLVCLSVSTCFGQLWCAGWNSFHPAYQTVIHTE